MTLRAAGRYAIAHAVIAAVVAAAATAQRESADGWIALFNGRDLTGWTVKIAKHNLGENFANTFRVENGVLRVAYDGYANFDSQFGHLYYNQPFSRYHLVVEYRFVGAHHTGTPDWAIRNSGVMVHSQDPKTVLKDQDFPISVEVQFLGGMSNGRARTTANMCSPGTEVVIGTAMARSHCVNSSSKTFDGDQWVRAEVIVLGDSLIKHIVNGDTVMTYTKPQIGGGTVNGFDPAVKKDGTPLTSGFIALQSEGHPVEFRRVSLRPLKRD